MIMKKTKQEKKRWCLRENIEKFIENNKLILKLQQRIKSEKHNLLKKLTRNTYIWNEQRLGMQKRKNER